MPKPAQWAAATIIRLSAMSKRSTEVPALYLAEPEVMLDVLQGASGRVVAMLGHNPGIGQMAGRLLAEAPDHPDFERFPTLATLIADFDIDDWADVSWGSGRAVDFIVPRALLPD